jgi:diguanylate cyclase (GGDEF)-like protein
MQPDIFDHFQDAVCILNEDLYPVYFNLSFAALIQETSTRLIYKKKIYNLITLEDFEWENIYQSSLLPMESQPREIQFKIKNRAGILKLAWKSTRLEEGKFQIVLNLRDVTSESELSKKFNEQILQKNETIKSLDEHIFQISLIKNVHEKASCDDDPLVMLRTLFNNFVQILKLEYVMYIRKNDLTLEPQLKVCASPTRVDDRLIQNHIEAFSSELMSSGLSNSKYNEIHWISLNFKDDSDQMRYFVFGKIERFSSKEEKTIESLCDALSKSLDNRELFKKAITDDMTDLYNHRYFKLRLEKEMHEHESSRKKMGLFMLDIDFFKRVNDTYGHLAGDIVLNAFANCLKNFCRTTDISARYGGEEFALILQDIDETNAFSIGDRLRQTIEKLNISLPGVEKKLNITVSIGVSLYPTHAQSPMDLIAAADKCLYQAKKMGRNKCIVMNEAISKIITDKNPPSKGNSKRKAA